MSSELQLCAAELQLCTVVLQLRAVVLWVLMAEAQVCGTVLQFYGSLPRLLTNDLRWRRLKHSLVGIIVRLLWLGEYLCRRLATLWVRGGRRWRRDLRKDTVMAQTPKQTLDDINATTSAWSTLAPAASFGGMTLTQYKNKVKASLDARDAVDTLNNQLTAAMDQRDNADAVSADANQKVVKGIVGDANFGDDSDLYDAMGYVRKSDRKSGLSRGSKTKAAVVPSK